MGFLNLVLTNSVNQKPIQVSRDKNLSIEISLGWVFLHSMSLTSDDGSLA